MRGDCVPSTGGVWLRLGLKERTTEKEKTKGMVKLHLQAPETDAEGWSPPGSPHFKQLGTPDDRLEPLGARAGRGFFSVGRFLHRKGFTNAPLSC